jgi:ribonuclease Z
MDCGEGMQKKFLSMGLGLNRRTTIAVTHMHGDHVTGILGLLQTMSLAQRTLPVTVIGPRKLKDWLEFTFEVLGMGLTFDLRFVGASEGIVFEEKEYVIKSVKTYHSTESYGYMFVEKARPGKFFPEKATELGIPEGKKWSILQHGRPVIVEGRKILPSMVMGKRRPGRRIGYSGDTRPTEKLVKFYRGADLLIFDSTFSSKDSLRAKERMHSTSVEAALLAKRAGVEMLALTHFSARYRNTNFLLKEARKIFQNTVAARDGLVLEIQMKE